MVSLQAIEGRSNERFAHRDIGATSRRELQALLSGGVGTVDGVHLLQQPGYLPHRLSAFPLPDGC